MLALFVLALLILASDYDADVELLIPLNKLISYRVGSIGNDEIN